LYLNGEQKLISIDDYVPVTGEGMPLCAMTSSEGEIWLALLEKGCAKVFQGYDNL
jgi:hypothetical protein